MPQGSHLHQGRARAQPQEHRRDHPPGPAGGHHWRVRLRQEQPGFRHIYAEGQRRYVESLSAYARQFLGRMDKPDVDYIEGLSPAISIDQKGVSHNPRSTVGTVTEIYDYLRLLFARVGKPHCPKCGNPVARQTVQQIVDAILSLPGHPASPCWPPKIRRKKGEHREVFEAAKRGGFVRLPGQRRGDAGRGHRYPWPWTSRSGTTSTSLLTASSSAPIPNPAASPSRWKPPCARAKAC